LIDCFVGGVLPLNYVEYKTSEKAAACITSEKCKLQNVCCMDKYESKVYMLTQNAEFMCFEYSGNKLVETYADEKDITSNFNYGEH